MNLSRIVAVLGFASAFAFAAPALAQNEDRADTLFVEGRAALTKGNLAEACAKLAESDRLAPSGRAVLNLADCLERRGMISTAYTKFLEAASRAVQANRPDAEKHARERAARLEGRLARVSIVVPKASAVPGLEIKRNGVAVPPSAWNVGELADPGTTQVFEATAPGHDTWTATVSVEEGKTSRVELRWQEVPPAEPRPAEPTPTPAPPPRVVEEAHTSPVAWAAIGVGVVGVGVGVFGGLQVLGAKSDVNAHCNAQTHGCDQTGLDAASRGSTWSVVSPVALGVGVVGLGVGGLLLLKTPSSRASISPRVAPGSAGLVVSGAL